MSSRIGQQLGNYRLIRLLGQGGFAEVYLGEQIYLKSYAAIKVLHTHLAPIDQENFLAEARALVRLVHPHIVRLLDFGVEGTTPYLVMEYAPNGTLRKLYPKGERLPLSTVVTYVKQVADALQYAHDEKLIHRDIKPENMLLGLRHEVLLSDFGIAVVAQSSRYQHTQDAVGTIAYMAPEQIQAHPRPASDQYALGIVVYEWLCGERPFQGSFTEIAAKHCLAPPPSLHEKNSTISSAVEHVVMRALAKEPKQRFTTVQAFATALEEAYQAVLTHQDALPSEHPFLNYPSSPTPAPTALASSQLSQPAPTTSPSSPVSPPTSMVTPSDSSPQATSTAKPFSAPPGLPPSTGEPVAPRTAQQPRRHFSLRVVEKSLIGLVLFLGILVVLGALYEGYLNGIVGAAVTLVVGLGVLAVPLALYLVLLLYRKFIRPSGKS